ncbi:hypothetical protein GCM10020367_33720 [Streptomyces sannanensis]|uniref:Uncharacterized protein n=1 Tax=Streptomyces sannanensis TaxID=285536 RepID=A0ABP6SCM2_9ACTN
MQLARGQTVDPDVAREVAVRGDDRPPDPPSVVEPRVSGHLNHHLGRTVGSRPDDSAAADDIADLHTVTDLRPAGQHQPGRARGIGTGSGQTTDDGGTGGAGGEEAAATQKTGGRQILMCGHTEDHSGIF